MSPIFNADAWSWWQARRFRYNLALAVSGLVAYVAELALLAAFHQLDWVKDWRPAAAATLFLGILFLIVIGAANVAFLIGPLAESLIKPSDVERFRRSAYAMGYWGSIALPFAFPALTFA